MGCGRTTILCLWLGLYCFALPTSAATPLEQARKLYETGDQQLEDYELKQALASYQKALALFQKNKGTPEDKLRRSSKSPWYIENCKPTPRPKPR